MNQFLITCFSVCQTVSSFFFVFSYLLSCIKGGVSDAHMPGVKRNDRNLVNSDRRKSGGKRRKKGRMKGRGRIAYGKVASQVAGDVRWLMSVINVEDKYVDSVFSGAFAAGYAGQLLNGLSLGTSSITRNGQSVKCVGIEFRYNVVYNVLSTAPSLSRVILFIDKQPNAVAPTFTDVYTNDVNAPRTVSYVDRFTILFDDYITLNFCSDQIVYRHHTFNQNWHEEFNTGNAGTIADITKNSLYIAYFSAAGANFPVLNYYSRYVFTDN